mmetsp:Transcript_162136/g.519946  ORF Transcript_162136/g.519946 Transcript_162136/m.519946 type:complete len:256 (+) Transcript_162136:45-812(+)
MHNLSKRHGALPCAFAHQEVCKRWNHLPNSLLQGSGEVFGLTFRFLDCPLLDDFGKEAVCPRQRLQPNRLGPLPPLHAARGVQTEGVHVDHAHAVAVQDALGAGGLPQDKGLALEAKAGDHRAPNEIWQTKSASDHLGCVLRHRHLVLGNLDQRVPAVEPCGHRDIPALDALVQEHGQGVVLLVGEQGATNLIYASESMQALHHNGLTNGQRRAPRFCTQPLHGGAARQSSPGAVLEPHIGVRVPVGQQSFIGTL